MRCMKYARLFTGQTNAKPGTEPESGQIVMETLVAEHDGKLGSTYVAALFQNICN